MRVVGDRPEIMAPVEGGRRKPFEEWVQSELSRLAQPYGDDVLLVAAGNTSPGNGSPPAANRSFQRERPVPLPVSLGFVASGTARSRTSRARAPLASE